MNSFLSASGVFHIHFLFRANYMYACKSRFSVFSSYMFIHAILAVRPAGACRVTCLKASYTFAVLQEYRVQIEVSKKPVHIPEKDRQDSPYNFGVSTGQYSYTSGLEGKIRVNQPAIDLKKYRKIKEIQKSKWIVIFLTRKVRQISSRSAFVYVFLGRCVTANNLKRAASI